MKSPYAYAAVFTLMVGLSGCPKALVETFEESNKEMEAHRMGGPKEEQEPEGEPVAEEAAPAKKEDPLKGRRLEPGSAASRLLAEIVKRIKCQEPECSQDVLTRIRKNRDNYAPALKELLDGQQASRVTLEAVKVAGVLHISEVARQVGDMAVKNPGEIRSEAVWALGNLGGKEAVAQLRRLASVGMNNETQEKVCEAYGRIKQQDAIPDIADLLRSTSSKVRAACAVALGLTKGDRAVSHLAPLLQDPRDDVRRAAERSLRAIGSDEAKKALAGVGK